MVGNTLESMTDRGQTFTLEAFIAAILLVSSVAFGLQAVAISSNTASAAEAELRSQHAGLAEGALDRAITSGDLKTTLLFWDESEERFYWADEQKGFYVSSSPNTTFGESLDAMLGSSGIRYNINLYYSGENNEREMQRLVESGTPSDNAVRVMETVTLYDDTALMDANENARENVTLASVEDEFYAPNVVPGNSLYNVIQVEVVLWRT